MGTALGAGIGGSWTSGVGPGGLPSSMGGTYPGVPSGSAGTLWATGGSAAGGGVSTSGMGGGTPDGTGGAPGGSGGVSGGTTVLSGSGGGAGSGAAPGGGTSPAGGGTGPTGGVTEAGGGTEPSVGGNAGGTQAGGGPGDGAEGGQAGGASVETGGSLLGGAAGDTGMGGAAGEGTGGELVGPGSYALPPPSQCHNEDDYQAEGCIPGDSSTLCGGKCNVINACLESTATKPGADITFICPRFMLFSEEMRQAADDDGNTAFSYAIVGHDADSAGIDAGATSTCCQCYQLVFSHPNPRLDRQVLVNPDDPSNLESAIAVPPPLIVQSFNTAATIHSFDVYMAAGGLGANNGCAPVAGTQSLSGEYLYTTYPEMGQPGNGGVKPVTHASECKTEIQWVTSESLSSAACQGWVTEQCSQIASDIPGLTEQAQDSCVRANSPETYYHLNWSVYAMKVECPQHLTEVTGCRLAPQGLPEVDKGVTTAAQAAQNSGFWAPTDERYHTTTMEDCCRPSCASKDWIEAKGLVPDPEYNSFYSCDGNGVPITE